MPYDRGYEATLLRGEQETRPWDIINEIKRFTRKTDEMLDIGCGTSFKTIELASCVKKIVGLDPSSQMLERARENIDNSGIGNIVLAEGKAEALPFPDDMFDIAICIMSPHDTQEIHRVLKSGGYAILEKLGDRDQWNIKQEFGNDEDGPRGQLAHLKKGERARIYQKEFEELFSRVFIQSKAWKTWYTKEGLVQLLRQTPLVRNFDEEKDNEAIERIEEKYMTQKGIETLQERLLIIARK